MTLHAFIIWLAFMIFAVLNGGFRERILIPNMGEKTGHILSTITLATSIGFVTWLTLPWIGPEAPRDAWKIGILWLTLTLSFEFLAGHYLFRRPWAVLLSEYNVFQGRIWILVLTATFLSPIVAFQFRQ